MNLIETIIDATLRKIIDGSSDREDGSIHGVVVSDAYGNKPMNVWTPGTSGISLRTDDGEVVSVFVRQYDLMPPRALGWSIGDTLAIEGRMEKQNATCVFHDAVVRVTSQPAIEPDRLNGTFRAERQAQLRGERGRQVKHPRESGALPHRLDTPAYDLIQSTAPGQHSPVRKRDVYQQPIVGNAGKGVSEMTIRKDSGHELNIEIKGFAAFKPVLKADGKMALLKVGVQVDPIRRDYYDVLVFGPAAKYASRCVDRGAIVQVRGTLDFSVRQGKRGGVKAKATVTTGEVTFCRRGERHHARATVVGELGTNPYHSRTANGTDVSSFQVKAVRARRGRERTDTVDVSVFGGKANACQSYLYRGRCVRIEGPVQVSKYRGRDGRQKASLEVQASDVRFLTCRVRQTDGAAVEAAEAA